MKKILVMLMIVLVSSTMLFAQASAESVDAFPSKPVTAVMGWAPGGGGDIVFRALAEVFPKYANGQPLIIQNMGAAAGVPAITEFMKAEPNGYNVLHWNVAHLIKTHMNQVAFTATEFVPVVQVVASYNYLVVRADAKWNTLADFIADAKAKPESIPVGNAGAGGGNHMAALLFENVAGASFIHVPFSGGGPAITGLMSGQCDAVMANAPEGISNVQAGQLKVLAVFSDKAIPSIPAKTALAQEVDLVLEQWRGVVAPQGTPPAIVEKLEKIFKQCIEDPIYIRKMAELGSIPVYKSGPDYGKLVAFDDARYEKIVKENKFGDKYK
ncbi:MAG TPA: tripartite tricarboxylate transporter substrate binding protein [Sphaerochaeta sp.]|nr:tripartite tricarboxylate transporter substrate binding protein [Sphaerochaeta sp.]